MSHHVPDAAGRRSEISLRIEAMNRSPHVERILRHPGSGLAASGLKVSGLLGAIGAVRPSFESPSGAGRVMNSTRITTPGATVRETIWPPCWSRREVAVMSARRRRAPARSAAPGRRLDAQIARQGAGTGTRSPPLASAGRTRPCRTPPGWRGAGGDVEEHDRRRRAARPPADQAKINASRWCAGGALASGDVVDRLDQWRTGVGEASAGASSNRSWRCRSRTDRARSGPAYRPAAPAKVGCSRA